MSRTNSAPRNNNPNNPLQQILSTLQRLDTRPTALENERGSIAQSELQEDHRLTDDEDEDLAAEIEFDFVKTLKIVSEFKGSGVENFIQLIKQAKKTKRNEHRILLNGIIAQKLTDRAAGCVRVDGIETYGELFDRLRLLFGDRETLHSSKTT